MVEHIIFYLLCDLSVVTFVWTVSTIHSCGKRDFVRQRGNSRLVLEVKKIEEEKEPIVEKLPSRQEKNKENKVDEDLTTKFTVWFFIKSLI